MNEQTRTPRFLSNLLMAAIDDCLVAQNKNYADLAAEIGVEELTLLRTRRALENQGQIDYELGQLLCQWLGKPESDYLYNHEAAEQSAITVGDRLRELGLGVDQDV